MSNSESPADQPPSPAARQLAPGESVTIALTDMAYGGDAVGRADGTVVFAWGGISGETATVEIDRQKGNVAWGTVTEVEVPPSPVRIEPPCPYFGPCGGCQWQHISYPAQANFKRDILASQLRRGGGLDPADIERILRPTIAMDEPWAYRNVAHFQIDPVTRQLGYYRRESRQVVAVDTCPISEPGINAMLAQLQTLFNEQSAAPGDLPANVSEVDLEAVRRGQMPLHLRERKVSGGIGVWQVTIRVGSGGEQPETVVVLHTISEKGAIDPRRVRRNRREVAQEERRPALYMTRRAVRRWVGELEGAVTVVEARADGSLERLAQTATAGMLDAEDAAGLTQHGSSSGSRRVAAQAAVVDKPEQPPGVVRHRLAGTDYRVAPNAFFQVNTQQAERMIALVAAALEQPAQLLVDAFSGAGTFAMALLKMGKASRVVAIESDWSAVESARWTTHLQGIGPDRLQLEPGRVEDVLPRLDLSPDVVLLDPPRSGCSAELLRYLLKRRVPRLIYVSCDPSTLARDIKTLSSGYELNSAQPVDMFSQTYHIESVSILNLIRDA